jgi:hypothetical protein
VSLAAHSSWPTESVPASVGCEQHPLSLRAQGWQKRVIYVVLMLASLEDADLTVAEPVTDAR